MTNLDSMTARHAAGEQLTAEEVGLLLRIACAAMGNLTGKLADEVFGPAPAPQPETETAPFNVTELLTAVRNLYMAGKWTCPGMSDEQQAKLWEAVRDAAGWPAGTFTNSQPEPQEVCGWTFSNGLWKTGCGSLTTFTPLVGCRCGCGLPIREVRP